MDTQSVVSLFATVCTIGLFFTGIPVCQKILRTKSSSEFASFPFVVMFCGSTLWLRYGLLKEDSTLVLVNGAGAVLNCIYVAVFYANTKQKSILNRQLTLACVLLFPILIHVKYYATDKSSALFNLGLMCSTVAVLSYGAPLASVAEVIRNKSTAVMAFPLSAANFVVAIEWCYYGSLRDDPFVWIPNSIGVVLGALQLLLFVIYPSSKPGSKTIEL